MVASVHHEKNNLRQNCAPTVIHCNLPMQHGTLLIITLFCQSVPACKKRRMVFNIMQRPCFFFFCLNGIKHLLIFLIYKLVLGFFVFHVVFPKPRWLWRNPNTQTHCVRLLRSGCALASHRKQEIVKLRKLKNSLGFTLLQSDRS